MMTKATEKRICKLRKAGLLLKDIAEEIGCSVSSACQVLRTHGISKRQVRKAFIKKIKNEVVRKYQHEDRTIRELASEYKVSMATIYGILRMSRVFMRDLAKRSSLDRELELDICRAYLDRRNARDVGEKYGLSHVWVLELARSYGIRIMPGRAGAPSRYKPKAAKV